MNKEMGDSAIYGLGYEDGEKVGKDEGYKLAVKHCQDVMLPQAEISFKLGYTEGMTKANALNNKDLDSMYRQGIREVVEWINREGNTGYIYTEDSTHITTWDYETNYDNNLKFDLGDWQAKLKEWGVKDGKD